MTRIWKNILQWPGKKKPEIEFEEFEILVDTPDDGVNLGPRVEMKLKVNRCIQTIDSGSIPIVFLDGEDITHKIVGLAYCEVNKYTGDFGVDHAFLMTDTGKIRMQGIKRTDTPRGFTDNELPLWHLYRAAEINVEVAPEDLRVRAREAMDELKEYCDYVYDNDKREYEFSSNIGAFIRP